MSSEHLHYTGFFERHHLQILCFKVMHNLLDIVYIGRKHSRLHAYTLSKVSISLLRSTEYLLL